MKTYHVIVKFINRTHNATFHNVRSPENLLEYLKNNRFYWGNPVQFYIYRLPFRNAKKGVYCGFWNERQGFNY